MDYRPTDLDESRTDPYVKEAHNIVDDVIFRASYNVQVCLDEVKNEFGKTSIVEEKSVTTDPAIGNIEWLSAEDFTVDKGKEKIEEFLKV